MWNLAESQTKTMQHRYKRYTLVDLFWIIRQFYFVTDVTFSKTINCLAMRANKGCVMNCSVLCVDINLDGIL